MSIAGMGYNPPSLVVKFDTSGSIVAYCRPDRVIILSSRGSSLHDLTVYKWRYGPNCANVVASGGILVNTNVMLIKSVTLLNMLIYSFPGGVALELRARNAGRIAYGNFQDIRIRHARMGLRLAAEDKRSFVK